MNSENQPIHFPGSDLLPLMIRYTITQSCEEEESDIIHRKFSKIADQLGLGHSAPTR